VSAAYVDTSCLLAVALTERGWGEVEKRLNTFADLFASNLLEAEFRAACDREGVPPDARLLTRMRWVLPTRPLAAEIGAVLGTGLHLRGADTWHVACALYLAGAGAALATFLTLDQRQRAVAQRLGFEV